MPFSYWATMRAERARAIKAMRTTTSQNSVTTTASGLSMSGPHTKGDAFHALDVDDTAGLERPRGVRGRHGAPDLVFDAHLARFVAGDALDDESFDTDHGVHVARHRVRTHAGPHPAPSDEDVEDGEHGGGDETDERVAEAQP